MTDPILFVIGDLWVGGTELHLVRLLPRLRRDGLTVLVYSLAPRSALVAQLEAHGIEVHTPPLTEALPRCPRWLLALLAMPRLWRLMRRRRPAVVHFFLPAAYLAGSVCAALAGQRTCVMSRRSLRNYQAAHPRLARVERWLHPRMAAVLGNSQAVLRELLAEGVPPARLGLIYNGIDVDLFAIGPGRLEARARLGLEPAALVLVKVASLIPYKGHEDLLAALGGIADRLPPTWQLLCVGRDDGIGGALRARTRALGLEAHVRWLGERHDVSDILRASDIGVLASHEEGFSNSVLEGMAAGLPMIVSAVGGNPEALEDGVSGLVVPPRDPGALGAAILALAWDPERRHRLGAAALCRVAATFSLDACAARYARLYAALTRSPTVPVQELLP